MSSMRINLTRILVFVLGVVAWATSYSQNITITQLTGGVSSSPLANTATDVAIFGIQFDKAGGGTNSITAISIPLGQNPVGRFTNPRLVRSDNNNSFDVADLANEVGTPAFGPTSINFTGGITTFSGASGAEVRRYFLVVDADNSVNSATATVTPSLTQANVTAAGTVNAATITGTTYSFEDVITPTFTFNPLNGTSNVAVNSNIVITFDENVFQANATALDAAAIEGGIVELKVTNNGGAAVPFTATFNGTNQITINPNADLNNNTTYYVELNPVEDLDGNETTSSAITFTTPDTIAPTVSFNITDGATGVLETTQIIITFNEAVRKIDDGAITSGDLNTLVELKLTDNAGALVPFTANINGLRTVVTITPSGNLTSNTQYYVEMNPVEDESNNATTTTSITFTTGDSLPPQVTFNPANGATNVSAVGNLVLTFNEPIRKLDNSAVTPADIQGGLVELKLTNNGGATVPFTATINGTNTEITINPNSTLAHNQVYYVEMNPIEDAVENPSSAQSITFTTEDRPSIGGFLPAAGTCIADNVTVNGSRFTGTGSPASGNTQPTVTVNGVTIPALNIVSFTANQVVFTLPAGFATGAITVRNNDSDLVSANSASNLNVFPAINTGLTVTPVTLSPAQNTSVNIDVLNTQSNNYDYSLILTSAPVGYSPSPTAIVHVVAGNNGTRTLNTANGPADPLNVVGSYTYRIDVSRTGCTARTLTNTPVTLTVASLAVSVSTTNGPANTVCLGSAITLIGSASGGTGFYQFRWTATPSDPTLIASSSSPLVAPTVNTQYTLEVEDNAGNIVTDFVDVVVNPSPTATIIPAPGESSVRVNYTESNINYRLYGNQSGAGVEFNGAGVKKLNDGFYYFNPFDATLGVHDIVFKYTNNFGCFATDTVQFVVTNSVVNNLELRYCQAETLEEDLTPNAANSRVIFTPTNPPNEYQFTRLIFYNNGCFYGGPNDSFCVGINPLTQASSGSFPNIAYHPVTNPFAPINVTIPITYDLNIAAIRNTFGYSGELNLNGNGRINSYFILVYGRNNLNQEFLISFQPFELVRNGPAPEIVNILEQANICATATNITLDQSIVGYAIDDFEITPNYAGALTGANSRVFNPGANSLLTSGFEEIPLTITLNYSDANNCPSSVQRKFNWINKPSSPISNNVEFCQVTAPTSYKIPAQPTGSSDKPFWYGVDPIANPLAAVIDSINFDLPVPSINGTTPLIENFFVRQQYKGCKSDPTEVTIEINRAPDARFSLPNFCINRPESFTGPIDTLNSSTAFNIYKWTMGDGTNITKNNDPSITHTYTAFSSNPVVLEVTNSFGCIRSEQQNPIIGQNPTPDFTYSLICEGNLTQLVGVGSDEFEWDFGDSSPGTYISKGLALATVPLPNNSGTYKEPRHKFESSDIDNSSGVYNVTLTTYTALGCSNSITKPVTILDTLIRTSSNPYRMESLDGGMGYWRLEDVNGNSTWEFGSPTKPLLSKLEGNAWTTGLVSDYVALEKSFLNSPCLNIEEINRPVVSMNMVLDTESKRDGVVLEFSKDGGITWFAVGAIDNGLNWFNTTGFGFGNIGSSALGWSGRASSLVDNLESDTLVFAVKALDNISNLSASDRSNIRFRFVFTTDENNLPDNLGNSVYEGFGFNNLTINSRDRISLVENFTNNGSTRYGDNNTVFTTTIPNTEVAKIQYHVGFPDTDSEYEVNTVDPLARAAYYGIPMTDQQIPRSYIDGISDGPLDPNNNGIPNLANWATTRFSKQSLKTSDFDVSVESLDATDNSYFKIRAVVTAKTDIGAAKRPVLHLAVVEKTVSTNRFVLRKLVPNAVGHVLPVSMQEDDFIEVIDSVRIEKPQIDVTELAIVAFVQDVNTREVFQADLDLNPAFLPDQPTLVTAIEDLSEYINIYPNPANESFEIELPFKAEHRLMVNLIDPVGRAAQQLYFEKGEQTKTVNTQNLAQGIYVVQIGSGKTGVVRKKVLVAH